MSEYPILTLHTEQEIELDAGASATWILIPIKAGTYPVMCTVKGERPIAPSGCMSGYTYRD